MAENWNSRMIEGQLSRKGQLILGIDPDARVVPLYDTMHRSGGVVFTGARHLTTSFLSDAPSTDSAGSSHRPDASYCGYIWLEDRSTPEEDESSWELLRIGVLPDYRSRSLGRALLSSGQKFIGSGQAPVAEQDQHGEEARGDDEIRNSDRDDSHIGKTEWITECRILLEVAENNLPARKLYESCGFKEIHRRKNYYADSDALIMEYKESHHET